MECRRRKEEGGELIRVFSVAPRIVAQKTRVYNRVTYYSQGSCITLNILLVKHLKICRNRTAVGRVLFLFTLLLFFTTFKIVMTKINQLFSY